VKSDLSGAQTTGVAAKSADTVFVPTVENNDKMINIVSSSDSHRFEVQTRVG
jgi:hypothetical protein